MDTVEAFVPEPVNKPLLRLACFLLSSASQSGLLAGSPEPSELSRVSAPILPPPGGVVAAAATVGTGSGSDGLLPPAELPEVLSEAAEDLVFESSEARRVPFLSPLEDERLPRASASFWNEEDGGLLLGAFTLSAVG